MPFRRSLDSGFITVLNRLYDQPTSWWRKLVDADDVFLAIRNNYINAYSHGMSIGKIVWDGMTVHLLVHEEYLTLTNRDPYVDLLANATDRGRQVLFTDQEYVAHLRRIKKRAGRFAGDERKGTNKVACRVPTVLDMEAAFEERLEKDPEPESEQQVSADQGRMDLVVLGLDLRLLVFEAKLFGNGELRAKRTPKVCHQLEDYHSFLRGNRPHLEAAYRSVVSFFASLRGQFFEKRQQHATWNQATADAASLTLDPIPRLLIFGFDGLQKRGVDQDVQRILQGVSIPGFSSGHISVVGGTSSIKEIHLI